MAADVIACCCAAPPWKKNDRGSEPLPKLPVPSRAGGPLHPTDRQKNSRLASDRTRTHFRLFGASPPSRRRDAVGELHGAGFSGPGEKGRELVFADDVEGVDDAGDVLKEGTVSLLLLRGMPGLGRGKELTPRMVSRMLRSRRESQPSSRKTPRGGRRTAKIILQMSLGGSVSDGL